MTITYQVVGRSPAEPVTTSGQVVQSGNIVLPEMKPEIKIPELSPVINLPEMSPVINLPEMNPVIKTDLYPTIEVKLEHDHDAISNMYIANTFSAKKIFIFVASVIVFNASVLSTGIYLALKFWAK